MKYVICLCLSFLYFSNLVIASDTYIGGELESLINIEVITDNQLKRDVPDIRTQSTPDEGSTIARIYCDNNNYNGFSLTLSSDRLGMLVFYKNNEYPSILDDGHYIDYTLDLNRGETGYLGIDLPPEIETEGFSLSQPYEIFFNDNVVEATNNAEFVLKLHLINKLSLFHGVFRDTITITIKDI
tara:strand:+ start:907 stop:1458 length:552 start_codon:yes stop_codon:yes gene_type:complete